MRLNDGLAKIRKSLRWWQAWLGLALRSCLMKGLCQIVKNCVRIWTWCKWGTRDLLQAYECDLNVQMNNTSKMDKLFKKCIVLNGVSKANGRCLVQVPKTFWVRRRSSKLLRELKPMARKEVMWCLTTKGLRQNRSQGKERKKLGHQTNTKGKPKVQLQTRVAPKKESHPMLETKNVFMVLNQIMFVPRAECQKLAL